MTWRQAGERVKAIAAGLLSLGLHREERVGILCNTRVEWLLCDLGILSRRRRDHDGVSVEHRRGVRVHPRRLARPVRVRRGRQPAREAARAHAPRCRSSQKVILIDGAPDADATRDWVMTLAELEAAGAELLAKDPRAVDDVVAGIKGDAPRDARSTRRARPASRRACACSTSAGPTAPTRSMRSGCGAPTTCSTCGCRCRTRSARC